MYRPFCLYSFVLEFTDCAYDDNKLCRKEHYLEEKLAHGVIHIDHDSCLNNVPEPRIAEIIKAEIT